MLSALLRSSDRTLLLLVLCYVGSIFLLRLNLGPSVGLDDAEQLIWSQSPQLGYGTQPPLYTWLLWGLGQVFGTHLTTVVLLREFLFAAILLFAYLGAREVTGSRDLALLSTLTLLLFPQVSIDLHKEGTHTLLLTLANALTFLVTVRLMRHQTLAGYLLLGAAVALGLLSKYSYVVFAGALLLSGLSLPAGRRVLFDRRVLVALGTALLLLSPHIYWLLTAPGGLAEVGRVVSDETARTETTQFLAGGLDLFRAYLGVLGLPLLVLGGVLLAGGRPSAQGLRPDPLAVPLTARLLLFLSLLFLLGVALFDASQFHTHWMPPLLMTVPILLLAGFAGRLGETTLRRLLAVNLALALLLPLLWFASLYLPDRFGRYDRVGAPFPALAERLRGDGFSGGQIIADSSWVAGNLLLQFPGSRAVDAPAEAGQPTLIVGEAGSITDQLFRSVAPGASPRSVSLPYRHSQQRPLRFDYLVLPAHGGR